jgi:hypothetical protein
MRLKQLIVIALIIVILYCTYNNIDGFIDGFVDTKRCGVDLPSCPVGLRCMNGYCKSDIAPVLPHFSDLPLTPDR